MMRMMVDEDDASHKGKSLGDKCSLTVPLKYQFHGQTVLHDHQLQGWVDEKWGIEPMTFEFYVLN